VADRFATFERGRRRKPARFAGDRSRPRSIVGWSLTMLMVGVVKELVIAG
jgi:hypothetical protein